MKTSFAQNREDIVLWRIFETIEKGTYVDIGANHPKHSSITRSFYDAGWSGVLVEPSPEWHPLIQTERPRDTLVTKAAFSKKGFEELVIIKGSGNSTLIPAGVASSEFEPLDREVFTVETDTLDGILNDVMTPNQTMHFMVIDVEGSEAEVLKGAAFESFRPWVIVIEATRPNTKIQCHADWEHLILQAGYEYCLFDGLNRFYVAQEMSHFKASISYPACIFDSGFESAETADLKSQLAWVKAQLTQITSQVSVN